MPLDSGNQMHTMHHMNHMNHTVNNSSSFMVQDDLKLMRLLEDMHLEESEINRLMLLKSNTTANKTSTSPLHLNLMNQNSVRKLLDLNIIDQLHTCSSSSSSCDGDIDTTPTPPPSQPGQLASSSVEFAGKQGVADSNNKPMLKDLVELDQDMDYLEDQLDLNEMKKPDPAFLHELNDVDELDKVPVVPVPAPAPAPKCESDCDVVSGAIGRLSVSGSELCQMIRFKSVRDDQAGR
ncbi:unnamed protein product [Ambrosiozyma monospora]|uniref:Unnamed protein product n=1 Tax=Ambrosiozyma monospora TaxID=43982 RepID=A0ACB5T7L1_AMBMO|nr:unnamed protein product [Ambrosiozyma monospora]